MWKFFLSLPSLFKQLIGAAGVALAGLVAVLVYGHAKKREGVHEAATQALQDDVKKLEKAREAAYEEKRRTSGLSDSDIVDRIRSREEDWGKL